jgi:hypothetical protein
MRGSDDPPWNGEVSVSLLALLSLPALLSLGCLIAALTINTIDLRLKDGSSLSGEGQSTQNT